ncbi:MAG: ribokinase [Oscillospiraceae bacterium]|nr:ribokinase [Oscillospiraceae bacterium]
MKILNFGSLNIDKVYQVKNFVRPGETISSESMNFFCGGKGLNQTIAIARAGSDVYHAGCIGSDGEMLKEELKRNNVNTDYVKTLDMPTGHAVIQVSESGQNCIILFGGANQAISPEQIDETLSHFSKGDIILLQNEISNLEYIIDEAYKKGMLIFLNPSPVTDKLRKLPLEKIHCLILNEIEASDICQTQLETPADYAQLLHKKYPGSCILLTMGTKGSIYVSDHEQHFQDVYKVSAVDTTAAGDTFTGYFISAVSRGKDVKTAMNEASKASSIAVTRAGASSSIPLLAELDL